MSWPVLGLRDQQKLGVLDLLLPDFTIGVNHDPLLHLLDSCASLARIRCLKDLVQLFQGNAFGFDEEEVNNDKFEKVPKDEEDIEPEADLFENRNQFKFPYHRGEIRKDGRLTF